MSQLNMPTYDVERPTGVCAFTGKPLESGHRYFATLIEVDEPVEGSASQSGAVALGLKRLDVSDETWQQGKRPENLFCYWRTTVPQPNQKKKLFVDDAVLLNLLARLADTEQPQRLAFRFVLALILMRKRLLRYDRTEKRQLQDSPDHIQEWWLVTPKLDLSKGLLGKWNDAEQMEILNPQLGDEQIQQVTEQLSEILEAEL